MTEEEAMLVTIRANPDDDLPRLVYADWIQEHGDEARAEFIRVGCEIAKFPDCGHARQGLVVLDGTCKICPLVRWERELRSRHGKAWSATPGFTPYAQTTVFRRGFPERWIMDAESWLRHGDAIYRYHPVREVELTTRPAIAVGPPDRAKLDERDCWFSGFDRPTVAVSYLANPDAAADRVANSLLSAYWPGVRFTLPQVGVPASIQMLSRRFRAGLALQLQPGPAAEVRPGDRVYLGPTGESLYARAGDSAHLPIGTVVEVRGGGWVIVEPTTTPPPDTPAE